ncbi:glucose-6-phosphate dehydrogenase [Alicyclobacillus sp. TC]|uniref:glucose-6-phosphate dehydrogenase n=1 Tax=Alicyclobacillus sp. TC TaxID=2606450 RepID=UPI00193150B1|nr:glucose-6-phosphate dehydrogenase [Alicyclobacillus sp. TC]QRF24644.1 glucose-6-phosphate dehydrogenase [Alicyclobacillus sp. TC]
MMIEESKIEPHTFILFGATGDLARRKLIPALYNMYLRGQIPADTRIVNVARSAYDDHGYRTLAREAMREFAPKSITKEDTWNDFAKKMFYCQLDASNLDHYKKLVNMVEEIEAHSNTKNRLFYLAMAPDFFATVTQNLQESGLSHTEGWRRLIIEKPFGHDFASAEALNNELRSVFEEDEIYRIDHYLGKEMVQNIEVIRFANSIFEPVWNNRSISNIQITSSETVGVEDRASYYEHAGALRDMVQNHMLQMVMMIAMEPPSRLKNEAIRDEKVKVLRSLRRFSPEEVKDHVIRGQYGVGTMNGQQVPAYVQEKNVNPSSETETYVAAKLYVDNFRWAGVPFYIRTGKRLSVKSTEIVIQFRDMPKHLYFNQDGNLGPNLLVIRVNPVEGMYIQLNAKRPGTDEMVVPVAMEFSQPLDASQEAYERLFYDAMRGDSTFFTRWDEVSLAWKFVDPIAEAFTEKRLPLHHYTAGSHGPEAADNLLAKEGHRWWPVYGQETASVEARLEKETATLREGKNHENP